WRDLTNHSLGPIGDAITLLLDAGRAAGQVRDDADASDVIVLIAYLSRLDDDEWEQRAYGPMRIVVDGLRRGWGEHPCATIHEQDHNWLRLAGVRRNRH